MTTKTTTTKTTKTTKTSDEQVSISFDAATKAFLVIAAIKAYKIKPAAIGPDSRKILLHAGYAVTTSKAGNTLFKRGTDVRPAGDCFAVLDMLTRVGDFDKISRWNLECIMIGGHRLTIGTVLVKKNRANVSVESR